MRAVTVRSTSCISSTKLASACRVSLLAVGSAELVIDAFPPVAPIENSPVPAWGAGQVNYSSPRSVRPPSQSPDNRSAHGQDSAGGRFEYLPPTTNSNAPDRY